MTVGGWWLVVGDRWLIAESPDTIQSQVYDGTNYQLLQMFGEYGNQEGEFIFPIGVTAVGSSIFVADSGNHRVQAFQI